MASVRPRCPKCENLLPRARLLCPRCSHPLVEDAVRREFEGRAAQLATSLQSRPWLRDSQSLPYMQRSLERGFLQRHQSEPDPDLSSFLEDLRGRLAAPGDRLLLEHLIAEVIRPLSRSLATYLERRLASSNA